MCVCVCVCVCISKPRARVFARVFCLRSVVLQMRRRRDVSCCCCCFEFFSRHQAPGAHRAKNRHQKTISSRRADSPPQGNCLFAAKTQISPFFFSLARDSTHYRTQAKVKVVLFDKYQHSNALLLLWTITTKNKRKTTLAHFALCLWEKERNNGSVLLDAV